MRRRPKPLLPLLIASTFVVSETGLPGWRRKSGNLRQGQARLHCNAHRIMDAATNLLCGNACTKAMHAAFHTSEVL